MTNQRSHAMWCLVSFVLAGVTAGQSTERVSVDSAGIQGNGDSGHASISADARMIAFESVATNLVAGDTNGFRDIFVHDRATGTTTRVSVDSAGNQADGVSNWPSISADGRYVAFASLAQNLVAGDTNTHSDVFVHDLVTGETSRVSISASGVQGNNHSQDPALSADGRYVAFDSYATNLVLNGTVGQSVFVRDRTTGSVELVSVHALDGVGSSGAVPSISADGRYVAFGSFAHLAADDTNTLPDIYVRDRLIGLTTYVSVGEGDVAGNSTSLYPAISADGRWVAFTSYSSNLVPNDNGVASVFVRDLQTSHTTRVSQSAHGVDANSGSYGACISADGRFVGFYSSSNNLALDDTNGLDDVFVKDRLTGAITRSSVDSLGGQGDQQSFTGTLSADGRWVAFESFATNLVLGDTNAASDIFMRDRGPQPFFVACFGDGSGAACPCANTGVASHGCDNSIATGGAVLGGSGNASLSADTLVLTSSAELANASSVVLQGTDFIAPVAFGDGLRCAGGSLKRLYVHNAVGGVVIVPQGADASISVRSARLGDPILVGATRHYQVYYRDPDLSFCAAPSGNTWNASGSLSAVWSN